MKLQEEDIFLLLSCLNDVYIDKTLIKRLANSFDLGEIFSSDNLLIEDKEIKKIELYKEWIFKLNINQIKHKIDKKGICFISLKNKFYPIKLKEIQDPPTGLFYKGDINILNGFKYVSIVGTRKSTHYGDANAKRIASVLAKNNLVIVSGMASGIDACAHKGALESGKTIAVLGTGADIVFPSTNKDIYNEALLKDSLIISEYSPGTPGFAWNFPQRNRIISGLSDAVIVIEADIDSGALITARFAIKQDRLLFALPGSVDSRVSYGPNALIKSKTAELLISEIDILEKIGQPIQKSLNLGVENFNDLTKEQKELMSEFTSISVTIEDLIQRTDMDVNKLCVNISMLELKGYIEKCHDGGFVRKFS